MFNSGSSSELSTQCQQHTVIIDYIVQWYSHSFHSHLQKSSSHLKNQILIKPDHFLMNAFRYLSHLSPVNVLGWKFPYSLQVPFHYDYKQFYFLRCCCLLVLKTLICGAEWHLTDLVFFFNFNIMPHTAE